MGIDIGKGKGIAAIGCTVGIAHGIGIGIGTGIGIAMHTKAFCREREVVFASYCGSDCWSALSVSCCSSWVIAFHFEVACMDIYYHVGSICVSFASSTHSYQLPHS